MFKISFSEDCTVHDLAVQVKTEACTQLGEDEFVELLLFVNKLIGGDVEHIFTVLANNSNDSLNYQMALCWLDANGFGHTAFSDLELGLQARSTIKKNDATLRRYNNSYILPDFLN